MSLRDRSFFLAVALTGVFLSPVARASGLDAGLTFSRSILTSGQMGAVTLTVTNPGNPAADLVPDLSAFLGAGLVTLASGPTPASTSFLGTGEAFSFEWTFSTSGSGSVGFSATVAGWDTIASATVTGMAVGHVAIQTRPALSASLTVSPLSIAPGDAIVLVYTVSNSGQAGAVVTPLLPKVSGSGTGYLALSPVAAIVPGGGRVSFTWVYTGGPNAASLSFTASGSGADANSGARVASPQAAAGTVVITPPSAPCASAPFLVAEVDGSSKGYDQGHAIAVSASGTILVGGEEDMDAFFQLADCLVFEYPPDSGTLDWYARYNSTGSVPDIVYGVAIGSDGSVYGVGVAGNTAWMEKWAAPVPPGPFGWLNLPVGAGGGPDELRAIALDPGGNLVVAGKQHRDDISQGDNAWVAKYDETGGLIWSVNYDSPASSDDVAYAVAVDASGSIYVAGSEARPDLGQGANVLVLKLDPAGNLLWTRSYTSPGNARDEGRAIALDGFGNIVVGGYETRADLGQGENGWVRSYDPGGNPLWTDTVNSPMTRSGGPNDRVLGVAVDPVNYDVFATGRVERPGQAANVMFVRWSTSGTLLNLTTRDGPNHGNDEGHAISVGPNADFFVAGFEDWQNLFQHTNITTYRWPRPGCLEAAISVSPMPISSGDPVEVVLTVTNTGGGSIDGVTPFLAVGPGAALLSVVSSPSPLASLAGGTSASFTWIFASSGTGPVGFTGTATGVETVSGIVMTAWASVATVVQAEALLQGAISLPPQACPRAAAGLAVTVTNTGLGPGWIGSATVLVTGVSAGLASGPVPPLPLTLAGGGTVTLLWTWSAPGAGTATFSVTVNGVDLTYGTAIPVGPLGGDVHLPDRSNLAVSAFATPAVAVGGAITVELTVTNTGTEPAFGIVPAIGVLPPGAPVVKWAGPYPTGPVVLDPGSATTFTWSYSATGWGTATFTMTAAGADACAPVAASAAASVELGTPAAIVASVVAAFPAAACVGDPFTIVVSVTNTGDVPADAVTGSTLLGITGPGTAVQVSSPPVLGSLAGGTSAHLTWTYSATGAGAIAFTATVTAADGRSSAPIRAGPLVSPALSITAPAALALTVEAPVSAIGGNWITTTVWVTNPGGEDAVSVTATAFSGPGGTWIAGAFPSAPVTIPAGPPQPFVWTWSLTGGGPAVFSFTVSGTTCGGRPVRAVTGAATSAALPAALFAVRLTLAPGYPGVGATVVATLTLSNTGGLGLTVTSVGRAVAGAPLGPPGALVTPLPLAIPPGGTLALTWSHTTTPPCGPASVMASAAGIEDGTGRALVSGTVESNAVSVTGAAANLSFSAATAEAVVGTPVALTAIVTDSCGNPVPNAIVAFTITAGGGALSRGSAPSSFSGNATAVLTLGLDVGVNAVIATLTATGTRKTVSVNGVNPLLLTSPGAALDRNVLELSGGHIVLARIFPVTDEPIVVRVFTASARLVRTLRQAVPFGRGQFLVEWDGLTEDEFPVARGVYIVDVSGGGIHEILKVIVK